MSGLWQCICLLAIAWTPSSPAPSPAPVATFPPHGSAYVTTLPAGASAWLDGAYVGQTPIYVDDLLPGSHAVTLSRGGWQPENASFDVLVGRATAVSVVMERVVSPIGPVAAEQKGEGSISVRSGPAGTKVSVDGVAAGALPLDAIPAQAGYHIVTLLTPGPQGEKSVRVVDVYPDTTTVVALSTGSAPLVVAQPGDDVLEPLDSVVPSTDVVVSGTDVIVHFQNVELECAIGSRSYTLNGKAGTLDVAPALVGDRVFVPRSLLQRIEAGK